MAARTSLIILIAAGYLGGAVVLHVCWQYSFILAVVAAPFGGSLAVISAALLVYLRNVDGWSRPLTVAKRTPSDAMSRAS
ncbi:hypothetical protein [Methylobacterium sp. CM6246]